jgi:hypothetical protein
MPIEKRKYAFHRLCRIRDILTHEGDKLRDRCPSPMPFLGLHDNKADPQDSSWGYTIGYSPPFPSTACAGPAPRQETTNPLQI